MLHLADTIHVLEDTTTLRSARGTFNALKVVKQATIKLNNDKATFRPDL